MKDKIKSSVSIKADSMRDLTIALEEIAVRANFAIVLSASVSTSIAIEADDADDLRDALTEIANAIDVSEGVEGSIKAPHGVWTGRTQLAGPTPMERMINQATGELFP